MTRQVLGYSFFNSPLYFWIVLTCKCNLTSTQWNCTTILPVYKVCKHIREIFKISITKPKSFPKINDPSSWSWLLAIWENYCFGQSYQSSIEVLQIAQRPFLYASESWYVKIVHAVFLQRKNSEKSDKVQNGFFFSTCLGSLYFN